MKWYSYILTLWMIWSLTACSQDSETPACDNEFVTVNIVLSMGNVPTSRLTYGEEAHSENEYYINPYDVEVLVFNASKSDDGKYTNNGTFVERAVISQVIPIESQAGKYQLTGSLTQIPANGGDYQIVALCNLKGDLKVDFDSFTLTPGTTTLQQFIDGLKFTGYHKNYTSNLLSNKETRIPMWGIEPSKLENGSTIEIDVLRALAKVRVRLTDTRYRLTGVQMEYVHKCGMLAHKDAVDPTTGKTNYNKANSNTPVGFTEATIPSDHGNDWWQNADFEYIEESDQYIIYIPEWDQSIKESGIKLTLTTPDGGQVYISNPYLYFADYSKDTPPTTNEWDILRNDIYDYTITAIDEGNLYVFAKAKAWEEEESNIGWDVNSYTVKLTNDDTEARFCFICKPRYASGSAYPNHSGLETENRSSEATYLFTLTGPKGAVWKAHLSNTDLFQLGRTAEIGIAREAPYYINVSAKEAWTEETDENGVIYSQSEFDRRLTDWGKKWELNGGPETDLYFTVTTDGLNEHEVIINPTGQGGGYKDGRLYPGTDTRIRIKQLRATRGDDYYEWGDQYK